MDSFDFSAKDNSLGAVFESSFVGRGAGVVGVEVSVEELVDIVDGEDAWDSSVEGFRRR